MPYKAPEKKEHKKKEDEYGKRYPSPAGFLLPAGHGQFKTGIFKRRQLLGRRISEEIHIARSLYYYVFLPSITFNASPDFFRRKFFPLTNMGYRLPTITLLSKQSFVKIHETLLIINNFPLFFGYLLFVFSHDKKVFLHHPNFNTRSICHTQPQFPIKKTASAAGAEAVRG